MPSGLLPAGVVPWIHGRRVWRRPRDPTLAARQPFPGAQVGTWTLTRESRIATGPTHAWTVVESRRPGKQKVTGVCFSFRRDQADANCSPVRCFWPPHASPRRGQTTTLAGSPTALLSKAPIRRQSRVEHPRAIDHVLRRGDRPGNIVPDDVDRQEFLKTLAEACQKTGFEIHAYRRVGNHLGPKRIVRIRRVSYIQDP